MTDHYTVPKRRRQTGSRGRSEFLNVLLFYVLPFIIVNSIIFFFVAARPSAKMTVGESQDYLSTEVTIKIKSFLPHGTPTASLDGTPIDLEKTGRNTYTAHLSTNGFLEISVTSINKMTTVTYEQINVLDDKPPEIYNHVIKEKILTFQIDDTQSGTDYDSIYGTTEAGERLNPLSIDRTTATVQFLMEQDILHVAAKDLAGNEVQATFSLSSGMDQEEANENGGDSSVSVTIEEPADNLQ